MTTETATKTETLSFPGFRYAGINVPGSEIPASLYSDLGSGEPAHVLAPRSSPLSLKVGLYMVGRDLELGIGDAESLPSDVKEAGRAVYAECQAKRGRGHWHKDAVMIRPGDTIPGQSKPGDDYVVGIFFQNIKGFSKPNGRWDIDATPDTKEEKLWLPVGGGRYIVPARYGAYNSFGVPDETVEKEKEAIERWKSAGLTEDQARRELSRFYRGEEGLFAVYSWSYDLIGPLGVDLSGGPDYWGPLIGSFASSRPAERSEAPQNPRYRILTVDEVESFERDRQILEGIRAKVNE